MSYRFGPFRVDAHREQLFRGGHAVPLNPKAVRLLVALLEQPGEVVTKERLLQTVWPGRRATLNNLSQHIFMLRAALDDTAGKHRYVLTVPNVGYRFVAALERGETESALRVMARDYADIAREFFERRTPGSIERAIDLYERALQYDPQYVEARAGLALCRFILADYLFESPRAMLLRAEEDARKTLEADPSNAIALLVLARAAMQLRYQWPQSERFLLDALRARPDYLWAHAHLAEHYVVRGRFGHARQALAHARSLGVQDVAFPRLPLLQSLIDYYEGSFEKAERQLSALTAEHPGFGMAHFFLAKTLLVQGRAEPAVAHARQAAEVDADPLAPGQPHVRRRALALTVHAHAMLGDDRAMRSAASRLDEETADLAESSFCTAILALAYGRHDRALRAMESAVSNRESIACYAAVEPLLEPLRALAGWRSLLRAMNLAAS